MANLNTQTTTTNSTGNSLTAEMKTFYDKTLIRFARPKLVHAQFGQKKPIPKNNGKTIEFRKFSPLPKALTPLTEGVTPDGNSLNVTTVRATVEQYGDYITTSDMLNLTAIDNVITESQTVLGDQAGRTLDTVIREKINAGTNVQYANSKLARNALAGGQATASDNCYLTVSEVKKAVATLKRNNASPIKDGCYVAIIHPDVANDLTNDPEWKAVKQNVDPKDWYNGVIGKIHGVVFVESTEAKIFEKAGASSRDVYSTLFIGQNAYGVTNIEGGGLETIIKQKGSAGTGDPLDQRSTVGWKATQTAEILSPEFMVRVESTCSFA